MRRPPPRRPADGRRPRCRPPRGRRRDPRDVRRVHRHRVRVRELGVADPAGQGPAGPRARRRSASCCWRSPPGRWSRCRSRGRSSPLRLAADGHGDGGPRGRRRWSSSPLGYRVGVAPVVVGLFVFGVGTGGWDVAMNVQGALVERRLGRAIMPRFHAGFSLGTVAGALAARRWSRSACRSPSTCSWSARLVALGVPFAVRALHPRPPTGGRRRAATAAARRSPPGTSRGRCSSACSCSPSRSPRAAGNDWIGVALIDGTAPPPRSARSRFAAFLTAMTAGRWFGPGLLDTYGRVPVIRVLTRRSSVAGLVLFAFGPSTCAGVRRRGAVGRRDRRSGSRSA